MSLSESEKKYGSASLSVSLSILKISRKFLKFYMAFGLDPAGFIPAALGPAGLVPAGFVPAEFGPAGFIPAAWGPAGLDPAGFFPAALGPAGLAPAEQLHVQEDCS